jgi:hypothetical protein
MLSAGSTLARFFIENLQSDQRWPVSACSTSAVTFNQKKEGGMGKLMVGVARFLPLCALLLLPVRAASQPAPLQPGLYTGITEQVTGCTEPAGRPSPACEIRFNIAASLDQLSPSPAIPGGFGPEGAVLFITSHDLCGTGPQSLSVTLPAPRITNGHWEFTEQGVPGRSLTRSIIADCAGQSCAGTYSISSPTPGPNVCTSPRNSVTWSATTTGASTAPAP